jgi:transposase
MQLQLYGNKIWIFKKPIDFRKSIDGLSSLIASEIQKNPQEGIYIFHNRQRDKIKCLSWHRNGFILLYKKLEKSKFIFTFNKDAGAAEMTATEVSWLLAGLEWQRMRHWHELNYDKFS